jgi:biopolymer transport protein ExbB
MIRTLSSALSLRSRSWGALAILVMSLLVVPGLHAEEPAVQAPANSATPETLAPTGAVPAEAATPALTPAAVPATQAPVAGLGHDLSPWGMYQNADIVVKVVMIGLALASILTWTIWIAKGFELLGAKRRLKGEIAALKDAKTLKAAAQTASKPGTLANILVHDALEERNA